MNELVYVVDDDEAVRDSLRWLLEGHRFRVTSLVFTVLMAPKMPLDGTMKTAIQPRAP